MYGSQRVKDAVVDRIRRIEGERPDVDTKNPDIRIQVRQHKGRVTVSLDISGESLHRRGYRSGQGSAPIKENLAVALLLRAGWPEIAAQGGALLDPMCGSGTLIIEGAMMAADIAPGILRGHYGFHYWLQHDQALWEFVGESKPRSARPPGWKSSSWIFAVTTPTHGCWNLLRKILKTPDWMSIFVWPTSPSTSLANPQQNMVYAADQPPLWRTTG